MRHRISGTRSAFGRIAAVLAAVAALAGPASATQSQTGRLSPQVLGLATDLYDPRVHYHQVRDKWIGVRTPDGR